MPRRFALLLALAPALAAVAAPPRASEVLTGMASALSEGNAVAFMKPFDPAMPGIENMRAEVTALLVRADVLTSLEILSDEGDDSHRAFEIDWVLQIRDKEITGKLTRRNERVNCRMERRGKKWWITAFEPQGFFAP